jgi:hypothetical protein
MEDKELFLQITLRHFVINRCQGESDEFIAGKYTCTGTVLLANLNNLCHGGHG